VLDFSFFMQVPIPEVSHQLSIRFGDDSFSCDVNAYAIPVFNYYAIILVFDMEQKFFDEFDLEDVFLNQYYPVENIESALSNMKALQDNHEWVVEQAYKAFQEAEWHFMVPDPEEEE